MKSVDAGHAPLIIDIAGLSLSPVDIERLRHPMTGGLILFSRNWQSRAQLSDLCAHIKSVRPDALIAVGRAFSLLGQGQDQRWRGAYAGRCSQTGGGE